MSQPGTPREQASPAASGEQRDSRLEPFPRFTRRIEEALAAATDIKNLKSALNDAAARRMALRLEVLKPGVTADGARRAAVRELLSLDDLIETIAWRLEQRT